MVGPSSDPTPGRRPPPRRLTGSALRSPGACRFLLAALLIAHAAAPAAERSVAGSVSPSLEAQGGAAVAATLLDHAIGAGFRVALPAAAMPEAVPRERGPMRIGFHRDVPEALRGDLLPVLEWRSLGNGAVAAALWVSSPEAKSIRVGVRARLAEGAEVRFFHPDGDGAPHMVTPADFHFPLGNHMDTSATVESRDGAAAQHTKRVAFEPEILWSPSVEGDMMGIEIMLPSWPSRGSWFRVEKVAHRWSHLGARGKEGAGFVPAGAPPALDCPNLHVDVQCRVGEFNAGLEDSVARVSYEKDDGSYVCTGTLLNDSDPDTFVPYFLTANHCVATPEVARTVETTWFYQRERCGVETLDTRAATVAGGAELLVTSPAQDATLLRIRGQLPNGVWFSGWDAGQVSSGQAVVGIHHPDGGVKKYSAGNALGRLDVTTDSGVSVDGSIEVAWDDGFTEGGSSGSALLRDGNQLIGTLIGGPTGCDRASVRDYYGPFADFFPHVCPLLDPDSDGCDGRGGGDDHGDSRSAATRVSLPSQTSGEIDPGDDEDYFRFEVPRRGEVVARTTGSLDTVGALHDSAGGQLATNDDGGAGTNFRIQRELDAGTYYVRVSSHESETGAYTLDLSIENAGGGDDHGDSRSAATRVSLPSQTSGEIDPGDDEDYFRFEVPRRGEVLARTTGSLDTVGALYDSAGGQLATNDDGGAGLNFRIQRELAAGTYYVRVSSYQSETGAYTLDLSIESAGGGDDDHGGSRSAATRVSLPSQTSGEIDPGDDEDYFRFEVSRRGEVLARTTGGLDTIGALYDSAGGQLATNDDGGAGTNFRIQRELDAGAYYVRVSSYRSGTGAYALHLSIESAGGGDDDHGDSRSAATRVSLPSQTSGEIDPGDDEDYFRFEVSRRGEVLARTTGGLDTIGALYDSAGRQLATNDDGGAGTNFRIQRELDAGTHYVRVASFSSTGTGAYTLDLSMENAGGGDDGVQNGGYRRTLGDFNGDGREDVLLRHEDGRWYYYPMNGRRHMAGQGTANLTRNLEWSVAGIGDFNGDGRDDVLLRHRDGRWYYYPMNGRRHMAGQGTANLTRNLEWSVAGIGDFNGDGRDDVLLRKPGNGAWYYYPMNGRRHMAGQGAANLTSNLEWSMAGIGDFNGDGRDDVLLRKPGNGAWYYYPMNGRRHMAGQGAANLTSNLEWSMAGIGDFNGDGRDDVLLRKPGNGAWYYYPMNGRRHMTGQGTANLTNNLEWSVAGIGDLNGDGRDDVLLRKPSNGRWYYYPMDGRRYLGGHGAANLTSNRAWGGLFRGGGTEAFAPADQTAFDARFVGKRLATDRVTEYIDFLGGGRFDETFDSTPYHGTYVYRNTGPDTGTLTLTYRDDRCDYRMAFDATASGSYQFQCDTVSGSSDWQIEEISGSAPPAPTAARADSTAIRFEWPWNVSAGRTYAFDFQARQKDHVWWIPACRTVDITSSGRTTMYAELSGLESATAYQFRYRSRDSSSCEAAIRSHSGRWSAVGEGRTQNDDGTGGGGGTRHGVGDTITSMPTGRWLPDITSNASVSVSGSDVTIRFSNGGYVVENGIRYTCDDSGGCRVMNRVVELGVIVEATERASDAAPGVGGALTLQAKIDLRSLETPGKKSIH